MAYLIYIGDESSEFAEQISGKLAQSAVPAKIFNNSAELLASSENAVPDILLLNASLAKNGENAPELFSKVPTVIYADNMEIDHRLELYNQGVRRIILDQENLPARVAAFANMILYRRNTLRHTRQSSVTYGTLQAFSLQEVLQNALLEKKNLILKIRYKDRDVKIRTFQGHIVNAFAANLSNEDAMLKTMLFSSGSFIIHGYQKLEELSPMSASTLAILAEAKFQQKEIRRFLEGFAEGIDNPEFQAAPSKSTTGLSLKKSKVLNLVKKFPAFRDVLINSPFPVLTTLRALASLTTRGFLVLKGEGEAVETFNLQDIEHIRKELLPENARGGNLIILGLPSTGRSELIRTLAGFQKSAVKSVQSIDFVRINLPSNLILTVFGVSVDQNLLSILEKISQSMIACIFLVDYTQKDQFEFLNYLFGRITRIYPVPFVVGLTNAGRNETQAVKEIRKILAIPKAIEVVSIQPDSFGDARKLLYNFRNSPAKKMEGEKDA